MKLIKNECSNLSQVWVGGYKDRQKIDRKIDHRDDR